MTPLQKVLAANGLSSPKLVAALKQIAVDAAALQADLAIAVSSNDQAHLATAANKLLAYASLLKWAATPGVDWVRGTPPVLTPPGKPTTTL